MYKAYVTTLKNVRKHGNADRLQVAEVFGNQVIVGLDAKEGDVGIYFPTDGRLMPGFLKANNLVGETDPTTGQRKGGYFEASGRVRTQKFRGEKSDGYFCGLESLNYIFGTPEKTLEQLPVGIMFDEAGGEKICEKYVTSATRTIAQFKQGKAGKKGLKETVKFPAFHEHIDTAQLQYNISQLKAGQVIVVSLKMHGTSGRVSYTIREKLSKFDNLINRIFKKSVIKPKKTYEYVYGTRRVVIDPNKKNRYTGFYGTSEEFRDNAHNLFVGKLHKGENVYFEIVGYVNADKPIMSKCDNTKINDKEFVKKYGKETVFSYGCMPGQSEVYVYRMSMTNEDGHEVDYDWATVQHRCEQMGIKTVPTFEKFIYDGNSEELLKKCEILADGEDPVGKNHIKEGVVVRVDGSRWRAFKYKSFEFKVLEGLIKDAGDVDEEEVQSEVEIKGDDNV